jgi:hypothetical protein
MRAKEFLIEGGWASTLTQGTHITPKLVAEVVKELNSFESSFNTYLKAQNLPPVEIGNLAGSTTYYQRDLQQNPSREYGDIDVHYHIPKLPDMKPYQNEDVYRRALKDFSNSNPNYSTENGVNVILKLGKDHVQVDFVTSFADVKGWVPALNPEYNVKGVLVASLTSSLAEALNLSFGNRGVQVKTVAGEPVSFRKQKGTETSTITTDPKTWAVDIARYFGAKEISPLLAKYPGMGDAVRVIDIINSIKGIAESIGRPEILKDIKSIYVNKITDAINSSKFEKAETPEAKKKAADTKALLAKELERISGYLN